ncbi:2-dehydro-3-deoxy-6-phosphogalactonate aldolase [Buttiauxella agrestis]
MNSENFIAQWQKEPLPLVAILRGITPQDAVEAAEILLDCGFRYLEVPLNSPKPLESISLMRKVVAERGYVGAGTVLTVEQVDAVAECGGQFDHLPELLPGGDPLYLQARAYQHAGDHDTKRGVQRHGSRGQRIETVPAEHISPVITKAFRAVIPAEVALLPVGGIQPDAAQMRSYIQAGANGFGLGGGLYQAGMSMNLLRMRAQAYQHAWRECAE